MSHHEDDSPGGNYPESPSQAPRWAQYKSNPADFALSLAEHSGFDAIARTLTPPPSYMTPPPSYSRLVHVQPRLTLTIPNTSIDQSLNAPLPAAAVIPDTSALESLDNSPTDVSYIRSNESSLTSKIKTKLKKRGTGFRDRLRRTSVSSRSSSTSTSPSEATPYQITEFGADTHSPAYGHELSIIQELDGQPIFHNTSRAEEIHNIHQESSPKRARHQAGSSSIVPTPRRGLSVASIAPESSRSSSINAGELLGRLQSLRSQGDHEYPDVTISPCTPVSTFHTGTFQEYSSLARSNAITDNISRGQHLVSPISAAPHGPSTPTTLEGRLERLPRLTTPSITAQSNGVQLRHGSISVAEIDSGKEVALPSRTLSGRLDRPFNSPHWQASQTLRTTPNTQFHQTSYHDTAANAPEVISQGNISAAPTPTSNYVASAWPSTGRPYPQPSPLASLVGTLCETALGGVTAATNFLKAHYGPEPPVPENHVRVRWHCACGEDIYDDYIENRPGAAAELEAYLNHVPQAAAYSPASSYPSSSASPVFSPTGGPSPLSSVSSWSSPASASPYKQGWPQFSSQSTRVGTNNSFVTNLKSYVDPLWLYTCVNEGKWCTRMRHLDVNASKVNSDKDLAIALGGLHTQVNRKWSKLLKLRGLVNIRFVQFELHRNRFADISRSPSLPDPRSPEGISYEFEPNELNPPVGSNYLMHLFKHPEDYDDELVAYLRTPKRRDRLELGTGWGLELVEGFLAERVWGAFLGLLVLGSLIFAIAWACKKGDDIQGAFSVAGYMFAAGAVLLGWAQAVLD